MISIKNLNKFFNKGRQNQIHVINNVSLDLPDKGMVAIFGESGCGKTTLLNVIGGLDKYASGNVTIEGKSISKNTDVVRNKYIGYIFQNYNLQKTASCFDNVADALRLCGMTNKEEIAKRVRAALINVDMEKYEKRTPDTLSGGQQQRIAIARAIVKNPRIILADEPTGNLDEANTVMIMDLLKAISKDHLVLLVTHEANLVDHYCDKVIHLSDGKMVGIKENEGADGFSARSKNDIYLGELPKTSISQGNTVVDYYGEATKEPLKLKIVNNGGKLYVKIETEKVQILDEFSEIKLKEGVFESKKQINDISERIDMSALPTVEGTRFGKLFSFWSAIKSGFESNFKNRKKGKKLLTACMALFASVLVFASTLFGSSFGKIIDASRAYNHNVFYVFTPDGEVSAKLNAAVGKADTGIDHVGIFPDYFPDGDKQIFFRLVNFETFSQMEYESNFHANAVLLPVDLTGGMELAAGRSDDLAEEDMLITTKVADTLLERSSVGYVREYRDLIGMLSTMNSPTGKSYRVAGIVDSDETAIYLTPMALARYVLGYKPTSNVALGEDYGIELKEGETVLTVTYLSSDMQYPKAGDRVTIQGRELTVKDVKVHNSDYGAWLNDRKITKLLMDQYFADIVSKEHPELTEYSQEFYAALDNVSQSRYYEYFDYYYEELGEFLRDYALFDDSNIFLWLYLEKGIDEAKHGMINNGMIDNVMIDNEEYFKAQEYKKLHGRYPTPTELGEVYASLPFMAETLGSLDNMYIDEFKASNPGYSSGNVRYLVSNSDYVAFSKQIGPTHISAAMDYYGGDISVKPVPVEKYDNGLLVEPNDLFYYTIVHSNDVKKTEQWLQAEFDYLENSEALMGYKAVLTPKSIFTSIITDNVQSVISGLITMGIMLIFMSICMYFIMRSSMMNRIKEIGIYRAIGVTKKNIIFRFFVEAIVLAIGTVFVGFLITSTFIYVALSLSALVANIFYYPLWLAIAVLVILMVVSVFFGTVPVISLMKKTPSEILAKYDI